VIISDYLPIILPENVDYIIDYRRVQNRLLFPSLVQYCISLQTMFSIVFIQFLSLQKLITMTSHKFDIPPSPMIFLVKILAQTEDEPLIFWHGTSHRSILVRFVAALTPRGERGAETQPTSKHLAQLKTRKFR
jgi:hypothetical protein